MNLLFAVYSGTWLNVFKVAAPSKLFMKKRHVSLRLTIVSIHQLLSVSPAPSFSTTYVIMTSSLLVTLAGMVSDFATKSGGGDSVTSIRAYVL